jgi:hypothetical protein
MLKSPADQQNCGVTESELISLRSPAPPHYLSEWRRKKPTLDIALCVIEFALFLQS